MATETSGHTGGNTDSVELDGNAYGDAGRVKPSGVVHVLREITLPKLADTSVTYSAVPESGDKGKTTDGKIEEPSNSTVTTHMTYNSKKDAELSVTAPSDSSAVVCGQIEIDLSNTASPIAGSVELTGPQIVGTTIIHLCSPT
ncbi:hypothetical protein KIN20_014993 [Parelaphostrongylus tenuis]|uniref:Uncharacterized protein n=1 Tax=Parelaphostrongylus tenuis TaxID=148309 RepID=A0AAD5QPM8_PARTN|nr:hypothetical protein KIN20_014993 [Parelaphostrongylus tenuis]